MNTAPNPVRPAIREADVALWLRENPDFLTRHTELFLNLGPLGHAAADGVEDLQRRLVSRLRQQVQELEKVAKILIMRSRENQRSQARVYHCVLRLLEAGSLRQLLRIATTDLAETLDLQVAALCIETMQGMAASIPGLRPLRPGQIAGLIPVESTAVALRTGISGNPDLYGAAAPLVVSEALIRLPVSANTTPALLAFGSQDPKRFTPGQSTELLQFLGECLAAMIRSLVMNRGRQPVDGA